MIQENPQLVAPLSLTGAYAVLCVNRGSYCRHQAAPAKEPARRAEAARLRDRIEAIGLEFPSHGYRRVTAQLRRRGWGVNPKRVLRIMREERLLCELPRRWVKTTDSQLGLRTYSNLLTKRG